MNLGSIDKRILIAFVLILFFADYLWDLASYLPPDRIPGILGKAGSLAPLLYMAVMALAVVIPFIPSLPLNIAAGAFFGPFLGTLYSAVGATAGAAVALLLGRHLGREFIERFLSGHVNFCTLCSDRPLTKVIVISRLLPFVSFKVVSYGAGLTMISLKAFSLATFLGMLSGFLRFPGGFWEGWEQVPLRDELSEPQTIYPRDRGQLETQGLYVLLKPYGFHFFMAPPGG
jgi:uncharacterized membrane protein YdjX (TVP38/TMEM64 family)